ncbi:hypothetical protein, partial [Streptomyces sp. NRRL WC-3618]|uniref:hypothetical protein n=1 Tax=Streptomyces sp. NRRL WC-3618 TaxID=1519490 RepID=UPI000A88D459
GVPAERVRAGLREAGIPISGGVRMGGAVSTGVKADHFPPLEGAPTEPLLRGPDQQQQHNNAPRIVRGEGPVTLYDPPDTHRRHKVA